MRGINTYMKTYTALVKAKIGSQIRTVPTEIRAPSASDARWLLQAIYGFHSLLSSPTERYKSNPVNEVIKPKTPEQQRIASLQQTKDRANDALKAERDRQKRTKAMRMLSAITPPDQTD